jgi:hypothetical protein
VTRSMTIALVAAAFIALPSAGSAQWVVHDPTNYVQALARYAQAVQQYEFWIQQAKRLPANVVSRYRVPEVAWRTHDIAPPAGGLDPLEHVLAKVPPSLRARIAAQYGALGTGDTTIRLGIEQAGTVRNQGAATMRAIQALEDDAASGDENYHSQAALLNKINGASVLGLRIAERGTQFLANTLEQLVLENARKRASETQLMNAHLYQWRYGERYGAEMFSTTAQALDSWRQP